MGIKKIILYICILIEIRKIFKDIVIKEDVGLRECNGKYNT